MNILVAQIAKNNVRNSYYGYFASDAGGRKGIYQKIEKYPARDGGEYAACYPLIACLEEEGQPPYTHLIIIGTEKSSWQALLEKMDTSHAGMEDNEEVRQRMEEVFREKYNVKTEFIIISNGITESEIESNFKSIKDRMDRMIASECGDVDIRLDITNAFRSVPMLVYAATNYLSVRYFERDIRLNLFCSIGESPLRLLDESALAFDSRHEKLPCAYAESDWSESGSTKVIPNVNITLVSLVNQWAMAINEFYDNGSVIDLKRLIENCSDFNPGERDRLVNALDGFELAVNGHNLDMFIFSVSEIVNAIIKRNIAEGVPEYISGFIVSLAQNFEERFFGDNKIRSSGTGEYDSVGMYGRVVLELARWYADQKRYGDATIALQEGLVTSVIEENYADVAAVFQKRKGLRDGSISLDDLLTEKKFPVYDALHELLLDDSEFDDFKDGYSGEGGYIDKWKELVQGYGCLLKYFKNSAMKASDYGHAIKDGEAGSGYGIEKAKTSIYAWINGRMDERSMVNAYIRSKLGYLKNVDEYAFFISYRRIYKDKDRLDGAGRKQALANALSEELKGRNAVWEDGRLAATAEEFTPTIRRAIRNSSFFIVLLGENVFSRPLFSEEGGKYVMDVFYEEIITAVHHFKDKADSRVIAVSFDGFEAMGTDEIRKCAYEESREKILSQIPGAKRDYEILDRLFRRKKQLHAVKDGDANIQKLAKEILGIESVKAELQLR